MKFIFQILVLIKPAFGHFWILLRLLALFLRVFISGLRGVTGLILLLVISHLGLTQVLETVTLQFLLKYQLKSQLLLADVIGLRPGQVLKILRQKVIALYLHLFDLVGLALAVEALYAKRELSFTILVGRLQFYDLLHVLGSNDNFLEARAHLKIIHEF